MQVFGGGVMQNKVSGWCLNSLQGNAEINAEPMMKG